MMKAFRPANPASFAWNYTKTFLQTVCFWFVFLYVLPSICLMIESSLDLPTKFSSSKIISVILFLFGSASGLSAGFIMAKDGAGTPLPPDCPNHLVVRGPYAFVRNPMAVGGISQGIAVGIWLGSGLVVLYALLGAPVWHWIARPPEEADMKERFGEQFEDYKRNVRLWIPRLTPYQARS